MRKIELNDFRVATREIGRDTKSRRVLNLIPQSQPISQWLGEGRGGLAPATAGNFGAARKVEKALAYMGAHLHQPIPIATLGVLSGVSTSYFYHLFKQATGFTPNDFLIRARMRRACELLQDSALSVKEVADALGYHDPLYFSRVFKSVHGLPPREYRIRLAEPDDET